MDPCYWWNFLIVWIPEVIQGFLENLSLNLLTFLSGAYLFSTEFIVSSNFFVAEGLRNKEIPHTTLDKTNPYDLPKLNEKCQI